MDVTKHFQICNYLQQTESAIYHRTTITTSSEVTQAPCMFLKLHCPLVIQQAGSTQLCRLQLQKI
jgi:hypothetical protein